MKRKSRIQLRLGLALLMAVVFVAHLSAQCIDGNCVNGQGTYVFSSGARYVGAFTNGEMHGIGTLYYSDGKRYTGQWVHRYPEGKGILTYPDGRVQKGKWIKGKFQNPDAPNNANDAEQESKGCLAGDCQNGEGVFVYDDGSKYEGHFERGGRNGFGQHWFANGERYEGTWKDNEMHGTGTKFLVTGKKLSGVWHMGEYAGDTDGKYGCIAGNCINGEGTYVSADGSQYFGAFENGAFHGKGICIYNNGDKYEGEWSLGLFDGVGTMHFSNGKIVAGEWQHGALTIVHDMVADSLSHLPSKSPDFDPEIKIWAVVVGVAKYNHMRTLNYTDDDAYRVAMFLRSPEGGALPENQISVLIDEDAKKNDILKAMHDVFANADSNDMVMFYFSGHGLEGSFIPYDFDGFNNQISHEDVRKIMESSHAKFKVCIADACHSGSLGTFATRSITRSKNLIDQYYDAFDAVESSTVLLLSSKAEEKSLESSGLRQGIFSHFLIRGLKGEADYDRNNVIRIAELYRYIFLNVQAYTGDQQTPIIKGTYDANMPMAVVGN